MERVVTTGSGNADDIIVKNGPAIVHDVIAVTGRPQVEVGSVAALDRVIAGATLKRVVAITAGNVVGTRAARKDITHRTAGQAVITVATIGIGRTSGRRGVERIIARTAGIGNRAVGDVGSREVVDGDDIVAAVTVDDEAFNIVDAHDFRTDGDFDNPVAVIGRGDRVIPRGSGDRDTILVSATVDAVVAVARTPAELIVTGATLKQVDAGLTIEKVGTVITEQAVISGAAAEMIYAVTTRNHVVAAARNDRVVAGAARQEVVLCARGDVVVAKTAIDAQFRIWIAERIIAFIAAAERSVCAGRGEKVVVRAQVDQHGVHVRSGKVVDHHDISTGRSVQRKDLYFRHRRTGDR